MANLEELVVGDDVPQINCINADPDKLTLDLNRYTRESFSVLGSNIRSCRKNFSSFLALLSVLLFKFSIIVLVETWLTDVTDFCFDINGYNQFNLYRNNFGGGIKIFCENSLHVSILENISFVNNIIEILSIKVVGKGFKYVISAIYRPPKSSVNEFNVVFSDILNMYSKDDKVIIIGDMNLDLFNTFNLTGIDDFMNQLYACTFHPVIRKGTRINCNNEVIKYTLLDQIWTNFDDGVSRLSGVITTTITDHFTIFYAFKNNCSQLFKSVKFRLFNRLHDEKFVELVNSHDFGPLYNIDNSNDAFSYFYSKLFDCYNLAFPIKNKIIKCTKVNAPWVNFKLKKCIKKKYRLFNLFKRGLITKRQFIVYKKTLCYIIGKIRRLYFIKKFNNAKDIKETWCNINKLRNKGRKNEIIKILDTNNVEIDGDKVADCFNDYFINVADKLIENLPSNINYEYFHRITPVPDSCVVLPTCCDEICGLLRSFPDKCNRLFDIRPKLLIMILDKIMPILVFLFNKCLSDGTYPDVLKIARVVPIFKSGNPNNVSNYRPISNLSTINKLFEKILHTRLNSYLENYNIISEFQFGFRKSCNTTLAVFTFVTDILKTFNKKMYTAALFVDLKKAFDTVNSEILLNKLSRCGIRGVAGSLLRSYLQNRQQYTDVNNSISLMKPVKIGVPQGSVLGPLLFNMFINDITNIEAANKILFADDAVFYVTDVSLAVCIDKLNSCISELSQWFHNNKLTLNTEKTKLIMFSPRIVNNLPIIYFNNKVIQWVKSIKYLGIIIDCNLNFVMQSKEIVNKLSKLHGVFYSLKNFIPRNVLVNMYYSLVYSTVTYGVIIWGGVAESNSNNIKTMLNKIIRCIFNIGRNENNIPLVHVRDMYREAGMLQYHDIYKFYLLKFAHFLLYNRYDIFDKYFSCLLPRHSYGTRNVRINLPSIRLNIEKQSARYRCCVLINELDECFLQPQSNAQLKRIFRNHCLQNY